MQPASRPTFARFIPLILAGLLLASAVSLFVPAVHWRGGSQSHTLVEALGTLLAVVITLVAYVRFLAQPSSRILFLVAAFLGTAFLDGYHATVSSAAFSWLWPSEAATLLPWSWDASRMSLAVLMLLGAIAMSRERKGHRPVSPKVVFASVTALTAAIFGFFAFVELPNPYRAGYFGRPQDLLTGTVFLMALIGHYRTPNHGRDGLWPWAVISLALAVITHLVIMPRSQVRFDFMFDLAHLFRFSTYACIFFGLLVDIRRLYALHDSQRSLLVRAAEEQKTAGESLRRLNEDLQARSAQLSASNRELEAFSYSVSHDLRAPLRHMSGFVDLAARSLGPEADAKTRRYLDLIAEAAVRMGALIDDLLSFSRTARAEMHWTKVDLSQVVREARQEVESRSGRATLEWSISALPNVPGDAALLKHAFVNLLSNAAKYSARNPQARIEVGYYLESARERTVCFVKDNGVGFDMQYAQKLFGVFQRLHHRDEFEGTGIGLANVRRIVERHGGETWAASEVGQGATFFVALPNQMQEVKV